MSLRCSNGNCSVLATADQLAFYQDLNNKGWNLCLNPEFEIPNSRLPTNIKLVPNAGDRYCPYAVICSGCRKTVGRVIKPNGFQNLTVNFNAKKVLLGKATNKWSKIVDQFLEIRKILPSISTAPVLIKLTTIHYHGVGDLNEMIDRGSAVAKRSKLYPQRYQWRAYFFACLNNTLLCLPTGMGKTLIACMAMKAYHHRNPNKGQVFVVPTIVLVEQQAAVIERSTGLKVIRRSGEHIESVWSDGDIIVCTPANLTNNIKLKKFDMSQISLIVLDEVHEAVAELSSYGLVLPYIEKCDAMYRPRVLALTASPSGANTTDMSTVISSLCTKLGALPYSPLLDDVKNKDKANDTSCQFVEIQKSPFEKRFEQFVFDTLDKLTKLHDFFKTNWTAFPLNDITKQRSNSVTESLNLSRLNAQKTNDIKLYQLTHECLKWIDAFDMIQVFGPPKVIKDILTDLDYSASIEFHGRTHLALGPLLNTIRTGIYQMAYDPDFADNSPRLEKLLHQLKKHKSDQERILIFVEKRATAERLSRKLKDDPNVGDMNPDFVVGNSKEDFPIERQQAILEKFHNGECRILVATSVLEQGIDVAACGIVVCFDGVNSMKSIIQSRGRARKKTAKFIVFISSDQKQKISELSRMESLMDTAIKGLMVRFRSTFDAQFNQEMEKFLETGSETFETDDEIENDQFIEDLGDEEGLELPEAFKLFSLQFYHCTDATALRDHVISMFKTRYNIVRVNVFERKVTAKFAVNSSDFWRAGSSVVQKISSASVFESVTGLRAWIESPSPPLEVQSSVSIAFDSLTSFIFTSRNAVNLDSNYIWNRNYTMLFRSNKIILTKGAEQFSIESKDIDGPIFINDTRTSYQIFLGLRNPSSFFFKEQRSPFNFNGRSFNFCLQRSSAMCPDQSWRVHHLLANFSLKVFNVCHLDQQTVSYKSEGFNPRISFLKGYLIRAWHDKYADILPPHLPKNVLDQLLKTDERNLDVLLDSFVPKRFRTLQIPNIKLKEPLVNDCCQTTNYLEVGRVLVTPSRIVVKPMMPISKNRIFRYFPDRENFLIVAFGDEHGNNPWQSTHIYNHFRNVLQNGIDINGKLFTFLGCSNSQLRESRCWFSCLNRHEVHNLIGEFPDSMAAGRKLTRIALAFASSVATVPVNHELYLKNVSPDVVRGGVNFSDGIGKSSRHFFNQVKRSMNLNDPTVCALQIRIGGIKGVISVYDEQEEDVIFRKSMKKFESSHNTLEVLSYNRSLPLFLNRHTILLLSSFGIIDEVFIEMQCNDLMSCVDLMSLTDDYKSLSFVQSRSKVFDWLKLPSFHIVQEPLFRQLLLLNTSDLISDIVEHANISVAKGRLLMGVLDETDTLEFGEVYAHIEEDGLDIELEGRVLIYRNPVVLPSDIRVLYARKNVSQRLKNLYTNCLVIPSKGPSSHAHECSGGDLDGDLYNVIWDQQLIPDFEIPGETVIEVETTEPTLTRDNSDNAMLQFYCDYVTNNQLGIFANAHLATADKYGMRSRKTIALARYVTAETDAPKKGYTVGRLPADLLPDEYPDYLMKYDKPMYRSKTVLGEMFRQAYPLLEILLKKKSLPMAEMPLNFSNERDSIEQNYTSYSLEIKRFLNRFDLSSEVELFSGTPGSRRSYKSLPENLNTLLSNVQSFWEAWKKRFNDWRAANKNSQDLIRKWYDRPKSSPVPVHSFSWLAIPFVKFDDGFRQTLPEQIHASTVRWILHNKMIWMHQLNKRYKAGLAIMRKLRGIECHFYGSSMLALSEEYSDIDLYVDDNNLERIRECLKELDKNAIDRIKPHACVNLTYDSLPIDVTNFSGGVSKTYALAETFDNNPSFWGTLRVLIEWARNVNIVKSGGSQGLMPVVSFCYLFIYHATSCPPGVTAEPKPYGLARFDKWTESVPGFTCGQLILSFLKHLSDRRNKPWIASKRDPYNNEFLIKNELIDELSKSAQIAVYLLTVHDGDVQMLFKFSSKKRMFRIDKRFMNPRTIDAREKLHCIKEIEAKCNPKKLLHFDFRERNGVFYLEAEGDNKYFTDVERGLNMISVRIGVNRCKQKVFHVENATRIFAEFCSGLNTKVSFALYESDKFAVQHTGKLKSVLKFRNRQRDFEWRSKEFERYRKSFLGQLEKFNIKERQCRKSSKHKRFFGQMECTIRCGYHYLINIPETLHNSFEKMTLEQLEQSISKLEQAFAKETEASILNDFKNYKELSILRQPAEPPQKSSESTKLSLMPLQQLKMENFKCRTLLNAPISKKSFGIRHSFYPDWSFGEGVAVNFALKNGFYQVEVTDEDRYTNIDVVWRQRELVATCDRNGMLVSIKHRESRWLSATFKRADENEGVDIRTYLKTSAPIEADEDCLESVKEYLEGRSIFSDEYILQIQHNCDFGKPQIPFSSHPLIDEMFQLNWRLNYMRSITPILKFANDEGDILLLKEVNDGIFMMESREFEWFPVHREFEAQLNVGHKNLCEKSYVMSLKLFDLTKKQH